MHDGYGSDLQEMYGPTKAQRKGDEEMLRRAAERERGARITEKELKTGK